MLKYFNRFVIINHFEFVTKCKMYILNISIVNFNVMHNMPSRNGRGVYAKKLRFLTLIAGKGAGVWAVKDFSLCFSSNEPN